MTQVRAPHATEEPRRRDAGRTRQLLLDAARERFANDGYAVTTVRQIAEDAGVNVALINRYFESKEGLFAACLTAAVDELRRTTGDVPLEEVAEVIAGQVAGIGRKGRPNQILLLLLRSSGDEAADHIRRSVLRGQSESLAAAARRPEAVDGPDELILRAQVVLSAATGLALLRASGLEPLASASAADLVPPLRDVIDSLLTERS